MSAMPLPHPRSSCSTTGARIKSTGGFGVIPWSRKALIERTTRVGSKQYSGEPVAVMALIPRPTVKSLDARSARFCVNKDRTESDAK
jgi:hypothetical protein